MAYLRLFKRIRLAPGLGMNLSRGGPSLTLGIRGAHLTFGRRGIRRTLGVGGTGVFWTSAGGRHSGLHSWQGFQDSVRPLTGWRRIVHGVVAAVLLFLFCLAGIAVLGLAVFR